MNWFRSDVPGKTKVGEKGPLNLLAESFEAINQNELISENHMARSTKLMFPGVAFCLVGLFTEGLALYGSAAIGLACIIAGCVFWISDRE